MGDEEIAGENVVVLVTERRWRIKHQGQTEFSPAAEIDFE